MENIIVSKWWIIQPIIMLSYIIQPVIMLSDIIQLIQDAIE